MSESQKHNLSAGSPKFEYFFELSADLFCIAGFDGFFKRINPAVSKLLEYSYEELFARPINDFVYTDDQDITNQVRDELRKNVPLLNFENRYLTKSGKIVWLSWTSMPVYEDELVFAVAKDITYKKRLEAERNLLLENLTKINKDLKQLTYTTSHDLRSPVNNLISIFNLLDVSKVTDPETLLFIDFLKLATENLKKTLNNYVDLVSQRENINIPTEELDLQDSLDEVLKSIHSLIENSNTILKTDFSALKKIRFNKTYLESIFLNLITNSIKYARPGFTPEISIYSTKANGVPQLIFSDNGLGFEMEKVKNKIFGLHQKFHTHSDSKGIGLYLVYNHITSLGGQINVESKINEGTKFIISFKD